MAVKLQKLPDEATPVLGKDLVAEYTNLVSKTEGQSIKDNADFAAYIDKVIKRYLLISQTTKNEKQESTLESLKVHASGLIGLVFSKADAASQRLEQLGYDQDGRVQFLKGIEQAGAEDELSSLASCVVTSESLLTSLVGGGRGTHCHHHHGGGHFHRHGRW